MLASEYCVVLASEYSEYSVVFASECSVVWASEYSEYSVVLASEYSVVLASGYREVLASECIVVLASEYGVVIASEYSDTCKGSVFVLSYNCLQQFYSTISRVGNCDSVLLGEWGVDQSSHFMAWIMARGPWGGLQTLLWWSQCQGYVRDTGTVASDVRSWSADAERGLISSCELFYRFVCLGHSVHLYLYDIGLWWCSSI